MSFTKPSNTISKQKYVSEYAMGILITLGYFLESNP